MDEDDTHRRSGSFSERESLGDQVSISGLSLARSNSLLRKEDCIVLKVHGITEAGMSIKGDLVRVLQNKLDDAVLEVLHGLLSRNPACKLTSDDVHFIQKPHEPPHSIVQFTVQASALPYLEALAVYLRQNLLDFVYAPKYMDNYAGHHFQDYSPRPVLNSSVYLYNRPQGSGNRGIACIAFAVVDDKGNSVENLNWPRPLSCIRTAEGQVKTEPSSLEELEQFIRTAVYKKEPHSKRPGNTSFHFLCR